jgi:hypothetical protein
MLKFYIIVFYLKCIYIFAEEITIKNKHYETNIKEFRISFTIMGRFIYYAIINFKLYLK